MRAGWVVGEGWGKGDIWGDLVAMRIAAAVWRGLAVFGFDWFSVFVFGLWGGKGRAREGHGKGKGRVRKG